MNRQELEEAIKLMNQNSRFAVPKAIVMSQSLYDSLISNKVITMSEHRSNSLFNVPIEIDNDEKNSLTVKY